MISSLAIDLFSHLITSSNVINFSWIESLSFATLEVFNANPKDEFNYKRNGTEGEKFKVHASHNNRVMLIVEPQSNSGSVFIKVKAVKKT